MSIYKVSESGDDKKGTGSDLNPFKTLTKVASMLGPGDELLVQGKMTTQLVPGRSGTATQPVTIRGLENAELTKQVNLANRQHIILDNLTLTSTGSMWVNTNKASGHNAVIDCTLDSAAYNGTGYPFVGLLLHGDRNRVMRLSIGTWYGGDAFQVHGDYNLIEDLDLSQVRCGHGPLMMYGSYNVVRASDPSKPLRIRNPWGRAGEFVARMSAGKRNLIQNLEIVDSNWDGVTPYEGRPADTDGQLAKTGGDGTIYRDISVRGSKGAKYPYATVFHIGNYGSPTSPNGVISLWKNMRFYDLVMEDNEPHAFAITRDPDTAFDCVNNKVFNSVLRGNNLSFWMKNTGPWLDSFYIEDSLVADPIQRGNQTLSIEAYEERYPDLAKRNSSTVVPPKAPLTHVIANSVGDVLTLDDALPLSDGNTLVEGDRVVVGGKRVQVKEWLDDKHVRLMEATTVRSGDKVWREKQYVSAPVPELPVIVEPPPEPDPVPVPVTQVNIAILVEGTKVTVSVDNQPIYSTP